MTALEPVISVRDVGVRFSRGKRHRSARDFLIRGERGNRPGEFWALDGVSFDVRPGEAIGVVGRNGQGKSTLLKLIAGVLLPDRGHVDVTAGVAPLIEITGGFVADLTVRDNISLTAGLHGMSRSEIAERFDDIVAFAVVSRLEEPVILVDEVLAVGDRAFKQKCYARIEELTGEGRTLFLVSHSDRDLRRFCDRGLYLRKGRLVEDGPMADVLAANDQNDGGSQ